MNPALPTVLVAAQIAKAAWNALPASLKKRVHEAVKTGKIDLARRLISSAETATEGLGLLAEGELENV